MSHDETKIVSSQVPPAAQLMQMIFGFMTTQAISVAARLNLADLLNDGAKSVDELAHATGTQPRTLYRILRALASAGIFAEDDVGHFKLAHWRNPCAATRPIAYAISLFSSERIGTGGLGAIFSAVRSLACQRSKEFTVRRTSII